MLFRSTEKLATLIVSTNNLIQEGTVSTTGPQTIIACGSSVTLCGNYNLTGEANFIADGDVTLSCNTSVSTELGVIQFTGTVDGAHDLSLSAGGNDVTFVGVVGGSTRIGNLTIENTNNVTAFASISAESITGNMTGDSSFAALNTTEGISLEGRAVTFSGEVETGGSGPCAVINGGTLTVSADMNIAGAFTQSGGGDVLLRGDIIAEGVSIQNSVSLTGDASLDGGGSDVFLSGPVNGAYALSTNSATYTTFEGAIGGTSALSSLTTNGEGNLKIGNVATTEAQNYSNAGVTLKGTVYTTTDADFNKIGRAHV